MTTAHVYKSLEDDLRVLMKPIGAERRYRLAWARCLLIDASRCSYVPETYEMLTEVIKILDQQAKATYEPYRPSRSITTMQRDGLKALSARVFDLRQGLVRP